MWSRFYDWKLAGNIIIIRDSLVSITRGEPVTDQNPGGWQGMVCYYSCLVKAQMDSILCPNFWQKVYVFSILKCQNKYI